MIRLAAVCATVVAAVSGYPRPQGPEGPLPIPREGSYGPDQYFQYINVPAHKTFEWGYKRGNPKHNREEYLSQKDHTFKAKLKWNDGYGGHGEHYYARLRSAGLRCCPLLTTTLVVSPAGRISVKLPTLPGPELELDAGCGQLSVVCQQLYL